MKIKPENETISATLAELKARKPSKSALARLQKLAAMPDSQIDTSDIPELTDLTGGIRGRFCRPITRRAGQFTPTNPFRPETPAPAAAEPRAPVATGKLAQESWHRKHEHARQGVEA